MAKIKTTEPIKTKTTETIRVGNKTFNFSKDDRICSILLIVLLLLVVLIRSKFSGIAFERDEGIYAYNGIKVLQGKIPYLDFYEQKFPGIFYFYAMMVAIFGQTVEGLHTGWIFINLVSIILIYFASRILFNPIAAIISAITFAFVSLTPSLSGFTIQSEHAVSLFFSAGILFYALSNTTRKWYYTFLMGVAFGCSFMVKTSGVFLVLWGGLITIVDYLLVKERDYKALIRNVLIYSAGVFLVLGIFFLLMMALGAFEQMLYWTYDIPKKYVSKMPFEEGKKYFKYTLDAIVLNHKFFWVHAALAVALIFFKNISLRTKIFGITLAAFTFVTIVPGFYFYGHYWIMLVPGLSIISGLTFYGIYKIISEKFNLRQPAVKYGYLLVFVLLTLTHLQKSKSYYFHPNYELVLRQVYGSNPFPEAMEIGNYINRTAKPEDKIVVIGSEPQIYFYTKKESPSRHAYFAAIVSDVPEHAGWQREFVKDVESAKPKYFIFFRHSISLFVQPNTDSYVFDWVNKYATENYKVVGVVDMIDGQRSTYVWNEAVNTYKPVSQNVIYIFERTT